MDAAVIILDGWGIGDHDRRDAIRAASTPNFDRYRAAGAYGTLSAGGRSVGLPEGGLGNSEVGHLTIGAGRIVEQAHTRINRALADDTFRDNQALQSAVEHAARHESHLHFIGLVSDAGVHSDQAHLHALIRMAAAANVDAVTHAITDGRDTPPTSGITYLDRLTEVIDSAGTGEIASVSGRYYAMDRDANWDRTRQVYDAIVHRSADYHAPTATDALEAAYDRDETDEFVTPTLIENTPGIAADDAVVCFNFRADRMRQLVRMLADIEPEWPFSTDPPPVQLVTMTEYDEDFDLPVAFPSNRPQATLGEVLAGTTKTQLRIAETEKYAHVTYFLNGGREAVFDGEQREIVASPDVPTYDLAPEMSAPTVTDRAIDIIRTTDPDVLVLNYANPDMVGHTGDYEAAITAVETVDTQAGRLVDFLLTQGAHVILVADHGNADDMGTPDDPHTAHTHNPVPIIYLAPDGTDGGKHIRANGGLADIAPTLLSLLGIPKPPEMTSNSLLI